jgi:hypothetical protein
MHTSDRPTSSQAAEVFQSSRLEDCRGCFVATTEHPQRAEGIAVRTNVLNGTARIEWAPHTESYVE